MQINRRRTPLVLMELIITILFFSVVSALCTQIFLKSYQIREDSDQYNRAVRACSSVTELIICDGGNFNTLKEAYPEGVENSDTFTIETNDSECVIATHTREGKTVKITVSYTDGKGNDIYTINTSCYKGGTEDE